MRNGSLRRSPITASANSTIVSVSGRGTSVAADSESGSPQNSFTPRMRATGSPESLRAASWAMASRSLTDSARCGVAASAV